MLILDSTAQKWGHLWEFCFPGLSLSPAVRRTLQPSMRLIHAIIHGNPLSSPRCLCLGFRCTFLVQCSHLYSLTFAVHPGRLAVHQHCADPCFVPPCRANRLCHGSSLRETASLQDSGEQSSKANQRTLPCSSEDHRGNALGRWEELQGRWMCGIM